METDILELHFVKEGNILSREANSSQKLMWNMGVVMAQSYTDQLSDNVRRSIGFKVRNGEWCGPAPLGYLNTKDSNTGKATIIPDPHSAELINRLFVEYATGAYSLAELTRKSQEWGLRSKKGYKVGLQNIHRVIQNPFYHGLMMIKGKVYPHRYEPLISKTLFDKCQHIRTHRGRGKAVKTTKYPFLFRGLIQCAVSQRRVTCDLKKGKYVYLICRDPQNPQNKLWVKESDVLEAVKRGFRAIQIPPQHLPSIIDHINHTHKSEVHHQQRALEELNGKITNVNAQMDRLTDLLITETVTKDIYERKFMQLQAQHKDLSAMKDNYKGNGEAFKNSLLALVLLASRAFELFISSKTPLKRSLVSLVFSNLQLYGGNLQCEPHGVLKGFSKVYGGDNSVRPSNPCCRRERRKRYT